jgi:hypothetical protein
VRYVSWWGGGVRLTSLSDLRVAVMQEFYKLDMAR